MVNDPDIIKDVLQYAQRHFLETKEKITALHRIIPPDELSVLKMFYSPEKNSFFKFSGICTQNGNGAAEMSSVVKDRMQANKIYSPFSFRSPAVCLTQKYTKKTYIVQALPPVLSAILDLTFLHRVIGSICNKY
jgi:hypothetical protein